MSVVQPSESSPLLPTPPPSMTMAEAQDRNSSLHAEKIRQALHLPTSEPEQAECDGAVSPRLRQLLARGALSWPVLAYLSYEMQMNLMDHMFRIFRTSQDRSQDYFFYSFWLLSLHHLIGYVVCPALRGVTLRSPLAIHGGGFSDIFDGLYQGIRVALKVPRSFSSSPSAKRQVRKAFFRELACTSYVRHPNIISPLGVSHDIFPEAEVCIVYPFLENGTVDLYVQRHPEANRMALISESAQALAFLHHDTVPTIIHGDLKPGNILVSDSGHAVLTDIGMGSFPELPQNESSRGIGLSWRYAPPELLPEAESDPDASTVEDSSSEKPAPVRKNESTDVYSFAMTTYEVISGEPAFGGLHPMLIALRVSQGRRPSRPSTPLMTDELWALLEEMWHQTPNKRPSMKDIAERMAEIEKLPIYHSNESS